MCRTLKLQLTVLALFIMQMPALASSNEENFTILWKQTGNKIIDSSVCYNYKYGSTVYRKCRSSAQTYFRNKCKNYANKYESTKEPYNREYKSKMDTFCNSARKFHPV